MSIRGITPRATEYRADTQPAWSLRSLPGETVIDGASARATNALPGPLGGNKLPSTRPSTWKRTARRLRLIDTGLPHARPPAFDPGASRKTDRRTRIERGSSKEDDSGRALARGRGLISRIACVTGKYLAAFAQRLLLLFSEPDLDYGTGTRLLRDVILRDRVSAMESEETRVVQGSGIDRDGEDTTAFREARPFPETSGPDRAAETRRASDALPTAQGRPRDKESWFLLISGAPDTCAGIPFRVEEGSSVVGEALAASLYTPENLAVTDGPGAAEFSVGAGALPEPERSVVDESRRIILPAARDKIEWLSSTPCRVLYPAAPIDAEEVGNRPRRDRRDAGSLAFITSLGHPGPDSEKDLAERGEIRAGTDLRGRLAAVLGGGDYDRVIGHAIAALIERSARTTFHRSTTLSEFAETPKGDPREPPETDDGLGGKRKHTNTYRKMWERRHGKEWPDDPTRPGRKMVVHHKDPLGDGGPDVPENVQPMTYDGHIHHHREDFRRWGARGRLNRKGGRKLHGRGLDRQS